MAPANADENDVAEGLARTERRQYLLDAVARLHAADREVIAMRYFAELSEAEMAAGVARRGGHGEVTSVSGDGSAPGRTRRWAAVNSLDRLEAELIDLGQHLAIGQHANVVPMASRQARRVLQLAAAVLVILGVLVAVGPTRRAIARFLGIGAVQIQTVQTTLPHGHQLTQHG